METTLPEFEAHLSEYLRRALAGEEIVVTQHGKTVLRMSPIAPPIPQDEARQEALALA